MSSQGLSFIVMPASELAELARCKIAAIDKARDRRRRRVIAEKRLEYRKDWLRRLFRVKTPPSSVIEEMLKIEARYRIYTPYAFALLVYGEQYDNALRLLKLALAAGTGNVHVTALDLETVG